MSGGSEDGGQTGSVKMRAGPRGKAVDGEDEMKRYEISGGGDMIVYQYWDRMQETYRKHMAMPNGTLRTTTQTARIARIQDARRAQRISRTPDARDAA